MVIPAPPYEPRVPTIDQVRPASVRLLWYVSNDGKSPIQYYKIGQRFVGNKTEIVLKQEVHISGGLQTTKVYEVVGLTPYTRYCETELPSRGVCSFHFELGLSK